LILITVEAEVMRCGCPAYTTSVGWLGYSDEKIRKVRPNYHRPICSFLLYIGNYCEIKSCNSWWSNCY